MSIRGCLGSLDRQTVSQISFHHFFFSFYSNVCASALRQLAVEKALERQSVGGSLSFRARFIHYLNATSILV